MTEETSMASRARALACALVDKQFLLQLEKINTLSLSIRNVIG